MDFNPPVWLAEGDEIELGIEGLDCQHQRVIGPRFGDPTRVGPSGRMIQLQHPPARWNCYRSSASGVVP